MGGVSVRKRTAPVSLILGRAARVLPPPLSTAPSPSPPVARSLAPSVYLVPSSHPPVRPPPRIASALLSSCAALFFWASLVPLVPLVHRIRPPYPPHVSLFLHTPPSHTLSSQGQRRPMCPSASLRPWLHGPRLPHRCRCRRRLHRWAWIDAPNEPLVRRRLSFRRLATRQPLTARLPAELHALTPCAVTGP